MIFLDMLKKLKISRLAGNSIWFHENIFKFLKNICGHYLSKYDVFSLFCTAAVTNSLNLSPSLVKTKK